MSTASIAIRFTQKPIPSKDVMEIEEYEGVIDDK